MGRILPIIGLQLLLAGGAPLLQTPGSLEAEAAPMAQWERISNPPPARIAAAMAYDSRRHRMLVSGGCKRFGTLSDLWALSLTPSGNWEELAPSWQGPPLSSCSSRGAVYDSLRDEFLIVSPGLVQGGPADTLAIYAYAFSGTPGWRRLETLGGRPPRPSGGYITVLDPGERRLLLISQETWALALEGPMMWTQLVPTGTAPNLGGTGAALDAPHRRVLVNGGGPSVTDTWSLDLSGSTHWSALGVAPMPTGRHSHMAMYDPTRNRLIVTGGISANELLDAWALDLDTGTWSEVGSPDPHIVGRYSASAIYDPQGDAMVVFGGSDTSNDLVETVRLSFQTPGWAVDPPTAEPVRNASMVYDDHRRRMLLFGGVGPRESARDHLNALDLTADPPRWARVLVSGSKPIQRASHMTAWDPVRRRMLVFGGQVGATLLNDLWSYSEDPSPQWTQLAPIGPLPSARAAGALAYDPPRDRLLLVGGRSDILDVWELPLSGSTALQWRTLAPGGTTPLTRRSMALVFDPLRDRMLMVAGADAADNARPTYALEFGTGGDGTWSTVAGSLGPYVPVAAVRADTIVVYNNYFASPPLETKQLALAAPSWTTVEVASAAPPKRLDHCGAFDFHEDRMVIFGGQIQPFSSTDRRWFADTWVLAWPQAATVGVGAVAAPDRAFLGSPAPNPARNQFTISLSRTRSGPGSLEILDIHGRRVMESRLDDAFVNGTVVVRMDRQLPPGVYLIRLTGEPGSATRRFCVLR